MPPFSFLSRLNWFIQIYSMSFLATVCSAAPSNPSSIQKRFITLTYESLKLPLAETMGLVGGNYLVPVNPNWYSGLGVYGAVNGKRGGFFTGGLATGWRATLHKTIFIDLNTFIGGGGGGSAPQGGGLMLRAAVEAGIEQKKTSISLGYSYINFPNGEIASRQVFINFRTVFYQFGYPGWSLDSIRNKTWRQALQRALTKSNQISLQVTRYYPYRSVGRSGKHFDSRLDVLGIRWRSNIKNYLWLEFETGGAISGNVDGFAQVLTGLSVERKLSKSTYWQLGALLGAAGGGDVNTDGGLIYRSFAGFGVYFTRSLSLSSQVAWTSAIQGKFSASAVLLNLVYHYKSLVPANRSIDLGQLGVLKEVNKELQIFWRAYRVRPGLQRYSYYRGSGRKNSNEYNRDINLVSLKLDGFINSSVYISGQALGAFSGNAGGYAVGLVGPGFQFNRYASIELLGGVAGGGGIAVGSGPVVQPMFNIIWPVMNYWHLEMSLGYIRAVNDKLSAVVTNLTASYHFRSPYI